MKLQRSAAVRAACFIGSLAFSLSAQGQADRQLGACYAIRNNDERLACYDALARPAPEEPEAVAQTQIAPAAEPASPPLGEAEPSVTAATTAENFGQRQSRIERDAEGAAALVDTITDITEVEPDKVQITLANGQVWRQSIGKRFLLRKNDTVRITQNPWGSSFRLEKDGKPGYIQVLRLR